MIGCTDLDRYLNRRLNPNELTAFEAHVESCPGCRDMAVRQQQLRTALAAMMEERMPNITEFGANGLVHRARAESDTARGFRFRTVFGLAAAAAALIITTTAVLLRPGAPADSDVQSVASNVPDFKIPTAPTVPSEVSSSESTPEVISASAESGTSFQLGRARVGLAAESRAEIKRSDAVELRLALRKGTVAVDLPPVKGRAGLVIESGGYTVSVVGTRFWVSSKTDSIEVGVVRGAVRVTDPAGKVRYVRAGSKLSALHADAMTVDAVSEADKSVLASLLSAESPMGKGGESREAWSISDHSGAGHGPASLAEIQAWIIGGQLEKAERALRARLARKPNDVKALNLWAACTRKAGRYQNTLKAYERLIRNTSASEQNQARFKAAALLQDRLGNHGAAVSYLKAYLNAPASQRSNTVEARMRLARALHALGRNGEYRSLLELIVREHGGTEAAVQASRRLEALRN